MTQSLPVESHDPEASSRSRSPTCASSLDTHIGVNMDSFSSHFSSSFFRFVTSDSQFYTLGLHMQIDHVLKFVLPICVREHYSRD